MRQSQLEDIERVSRLESCVSSEQNLLTGRWDARPPALHQFVYGWQRQNALMKGVPWTGRIERERERERECVEDKLWALTNGLLFGKWISQVWEWNLHTYERNWMVIIDEKAALLRTTQWNSCLFFHVSYFCFSLSIENSSPFSLSFSCHVIDEATILSLPLFVHPCVSFILKRNCSEGNWNFFLSRYLSTRTTQRDGKKEKERDRLCVWV